MEGPVYSNSGPQPQGQGPTLGQVAQTANGGGDAANSYLQQYEQALATTRQMIAPLKKELGPEPGAPGLLANIATFGMAGLAHHDYMARERSKDEHDNRQLELAAMGAAKDLVDSHANAEALSQRGSLELLRANLAQLEFAERMRENQYRDFDRAHTRERQDALDQSVPIGDLGKASPYLDYTGQNPVPSQFPGRVRLEKNPQTGGYEMPAQGSPMANALGQSGGGRPSAGTPGPSGGAPTPPSGGPRQGEQFGEYTRRVTAEGKAAEAGAVQQAKQGPYTRIALSELDKLEEAIKGNFPQGESPLKAGTTGWMQRKWASLRGQNPGLEQIDTIKSSIEPYIRAMGGASRMPKELVDALMIGLPDLGHNRDYDLNLVKQMRSRIEQAAQQYPEPEGHDTGQGVLSGGATAPTPGALAGGNARRLSTGKLIMEEP